MNRSVADIGGDILLISQFTLYGDIRRGKRPSYSSAMNPDRARDAFDSFVNRCRAQHEKTKAGVFGADMKVSLVNDGPVTILIDSSKLF
jgi:D-tyrosyl-tRNA(Tyr) deacylase